MPEDRLQKLQLFFLSFSQNSKVLHRVDMRLGDYKTKFPDFFEVIMPEIIFLRLCFLNFVSFKFFRQISKAVKIIFFLNFFQLVTL